MPTYTATTEPYCPTRSIIVENVYDFTTQTVLQIVIGNKNALFPFVSLEIPLIS